MKVVDDGVGGLVWELVGLVSRDSLQVEMGHLEGDSSCKLRDQRVCEMSCDDKAWS